MKQISVTVHVILKLKVEILFGFFSRFSAKNERLEADKSGKFTGSFANLKRTKHPGLQRDFVCSICRAARANVSLVSHVNKMFLYILPPPPPVEAAALARRCTNAQLNAS